MSRWMRGRTRGSLVAAFNAFGVVAVLVLGAGPALADPDEAPGDPGPVIAPVGPPAPEPFALPPRSDPTPPESGLPSRREEAPLQPEIASMSKGHAAARMFPPDRAMSLRWYARFSARASWEWERN